MRKWLGDNVGKIVVGAITVTLTTIIVTWLKDTSPKIIISQYYNSYDRAAPVPAKLGDLKLNYDRLAKESLPPDEYVIIISNDKGNGPAKNLSLDIAFPDTMTAQYIREPNWRIYNPINQPPFLKDNRFYAELKRFPKDTKKPIKFVAPTQPHILCDVEIKAAEENEAAKIEKVRGIKCD